MRRGQRWGGGVAVAVILAWGGPAVATGLTEDPEHWSLEVRAGVFQPVDPTVKSFFDSANFVTTLTGGVLIHSRAGIDLGLGYFRQTAPMRGTVSGTGAQERFSFLMLPIFLEGTYRVDYLPGQPLIPYMKGGVDFVYFRENDAGTIIKGLKTGMHGGVGLMIALNPLRDESSEINDIYLVIDGRYQWIDDFGGHGIDLSGWSATSGVHLQF